MPSTKVKIRKVKWGTVVKAHDPNPNERINVYEFKGRTFTEKQKKKTSP